MYREQIKERLTSVIKMMDGGGGLSVGGLFLSQKLDHDKRIIQVVGDTQWSLEILTKQMAANELEGIKKLYHQFQEISKEFMKFTKGCEIHYFLDYNYGMGSQGICMEKDGEIIWDDFFLNAKKYQ